MWVPRQPVERVVAAIRDSAVVVSSLRPIASSIVGERLRRSALLFLSDTTKRVVNKLVALVDSINNGRLLRPRVVLVSSGLLGRINRASEPVALSMQEPVAVAMESILNGVQAGTTIPSVTGMPAPLIVICAEILSLPGCGM